MGEFCPTFAVWESTKLEPTIITYSSPGPG